MSFTAEKLFSLLPDIYRIRDEERGGSLRMLLVVIAEQVGLVEEDIAGLYDNWFIETADDWVVPYLGDLLGVRGLYDLGEARLDQRARVANTLAYRRRKGTATMLEQLARDTTLWNARAVEFFQILATTQHLNHVRHENTHTPDLRNVDRLQLLDTPFDTIPHTADVRHIDNNRGKHNIPNVGIFLWRLQNYPIEASDARRIGSLAEGRYTFSPLGNPAPLFNAPEAEEEIAHLAEEINVPAPIRPLSFYLDLRSYRRRFLDVEPGRRPATTAFYGPGRSLEILREGTPVAPIDIICADLRDWRRPPAGVSGVLSTDLAVPPGLTSLTPRMLVSIGGEGLHTVTLSAQPTDLESARDLLEAAIRASSPSPNFRAARVVAAGGGLLVLPGLPGESVVFDPAPGDSDTVAQLGLVTPQAVQGVLSRPLQPFPQLIAGSLDITMGTTGPRTSTLTAVPTDVASAQSLLQAAIRAADATPTFTSARVLRAGDQLLVLPGTPGDTVRVEPSTVDHLTAELLGLTNKVAVDVRLGRLTFALGDKPQDATVSYNYGFSADLGSGPYDRTPPPEMTDTITDPNTLGLLVNVPADAPTLNQALTTWGLAGKPSAVIHITGSRTYTGSLNIAMAGGDLVIQAKNTERPVLIGDLVVTGGAVGARLTLDGLLISGRVHIQGRLSALTLRHCTLVPGHTLNMEGQPQVPEQPSLVIDRPNRELCILVDHCISGSLDVPDEVAGLEIRDSIIESPNRDGQASVTPALVSGRLSTFIAPSSSTPRLSVTIGEAGPLTVTLSGTPHSLATARDMLQTAIRAAALGTTAFAEARVLSADDRLIVLGGVAGEVTIEPEGADDTATVLRLSRQVPAAQAPRSVYALVSGRLSPFPTLSTAAPQLRVSMDPGDTRVTVLSAVPTTLAQARDRVRDAIRGADPSPVFANTIVASDNAADQLIVLPGTSETTLVFDVTPTDTSTLTDLALDSPRPAIAGDASGARPGPATTLTRTTMLGPVHVRELSLASEVIFAGQITADRRQAGCVRFSYLPEGSRTPHRFRCQPELGIATVLDAARKQASFEGGTLSPSRATELRAGVLARLVPSFTSTQYGQPAYGQLSQACPVEIRTGAEDGSEMGAFSSLKQPQREANLRASLDEYLRFGLEAGIFLVT